MPRSCKSQQEKIGAEVRELGGAGQARGEKAERLLERKDALASQVSELESQLDRMARDSRREQKEASRKLQETANAIRDQKLKEKIRFSKGLLRGGSQETTDQFEKDIGDQIGDLNERLRDAQGALSEPDSKKRSAALDKARNLLRNMESLEERIRTAQSGKGEQGEERGAGQQQAKDGSQGQRPGQGQQGSRTGSQGGQQGQGEQGEQGSKQGQGQQGRAGAGRSKQGGRAATAGPRWSAGPGRTAGPRRRTRSGGGQGTRSADGSDQNGSPTGPNPGQLSGGRPGFLSAEEIRQLRRELRERVLDAQSLKGEMDKGGLRGQDAEAIVRRMRGLEADRNFGDPRGLAKLTAEVVEDLKMLEFALRRADRGRAAEALPLGIRGAAARLQGAGGGVLQGIGTDQS